MYNFTDSQKSKDVGKIYTNSILKKQPIKKLIFVNWTF